MIQALIVRPPCCMTCCQRQLRKSRLKNRKALCTWHTRFLERSLIGNVDWFSLRFTNTSSGLKHIFTILDELNVDDAFYRYKMPRLLAKVSLFCPTSDPFSSFQLCIPLFQVEGKGNGIKTVIANMPEIAKALHRPPTYTTKYFGCELGAQTQFDTKNERYIVNGDHDANKLQELLDGFIRKFVLCQQCENPETTLIVKGAKITLQCSACGHVTLVDPRHKLTAFILKNPPEPESSGCQSTTAAAVNVDQQLLLAAFVSSVVYIIMMMLKSDVVLSCAVVPGSKRNRLKKGKDGASTENGTAAENGETNGVVDENEEDDSFEDDWAVNPDDMEARQRELEGGMALLTFNPDLEKPIEERLDMFYNYLLHLQTANKLDDVKAVVAEADRLDVKDKAVLLLCRVLFNEKMLSQIKPNRNLLLRFVYQNKKAQRYLLGGIEQTFVAQKQLMPKIPHILKAFYDEDILEEEVILEWGAKSSKKYVSKEEKKEILAKAEPFLRWLRDAEEESDAEDSDVEVVYDDNRNRSTAAAATEANLNQHSNAGDENDDIDIDDI
ncbi:Eukaryotic translation initiation factor 5 [Trichinella spiralis]|uniref:Eukaryotic translation initiation factor 5 n=1 Tax=Trichinella spiralis TaxID=6334 RepID=A0A0V1BKG3_TRISP|nr:Eukaryotic translation initiation factor 5 [Trichinella spiralis]